MTLFDTTYIQVNNEEITDIDGRKILKETSLFLERYTILSDGIPIPHRLGGPAIIRLPEKTCEFFIEGEYYPHSNFKLELHYRGLKKLTKSELVQILAETPEYYPRISMLLKELGVSDQEIEQIKKNVKAAQEL